jgi:hypothetical protein
MIQSPKFMLTIVWGLLGFMSSRSCRREGVLTSPTILLKSCVRLSVDATRSLERPVKISLSVLAALHTGRGIPGTLSMALGCRTLFILQTHQIQHHQTCTDSVISKTDFKDNISRIQISFSIPSWPWQDHWKTVFAEIVSPVDGEIEKMYWHQWWVGRRF